MPLYASADDHEPPVGVIVDTDIGSSVDDLLALSVLQRMESKGSVKLLGVMVNRPTEATDTMDRYRVFTAAYLHAVTNVWDDVPIGTIARLSPGIAEPSLFVPYWRLAFPCADWPEPVLPPPVSRGGAVTNAVALYRQLLAAAPSNSVEIVGIGFLTNLANLLDSPGDAVSPKTGRELVSEKVRKLRLMAGCFSKALWHGEYNIVNDCVSAKRVFGEWPGPIVVFPFEDGLWVYLSRRAILKALSVQGCHDPVAKAFAHFDPDVVCGRKAQMMWDVCPVLEMIEPELFTHEGPNEVEVFSEKGQQGLTRVVPSARGRVTLCRLTRQRACRVRSRLLQTLGASAVDTTSSSLRLVSVVASSGGGCVRIRNDSSNAVSLAGVRFSCNAHESPLAVQYAFPPNDSLGAHEMRVLDGGELWPGQHVPEGFVHAMLWNEEMELLFDDYFGVDGEPAELF